MIPELVREFREKFGLQVIVTPNTALVPNALGALLSRKRMDNALITLCLPIDYGQPATFVTDCDIADIDLSQYRQYPNPWKGKDKKHIQATIDQRWLSEAQRKLELLSQLQDALSQPGTSVASGYLLEANGHPITFMLKNLIQELSTLAMDVAFIRPSAKVVPGLIQNSADFLLACFTRGESYREWRDGKNLKLKNSSKFLQKVYKTTPEEFIPPPVTNWEDWGTAWESLGQTELPLEGAGGVSPA